MLIEWQDAKQHALLLLASVNYDSTRVSHVLCLGKLMTFDEINADSESRKFIETESILPNHFQSLNCRFITFPFCTSKMSLKLRSRRREKKPEKAKKYYFVAAAKTLRTNLSSWYLNFFVETETAGERERESAKAKQKKMSRRRSLNGRFSLSAFTYCARWVGEE